MVVLAVASVLFSGCRQGDAGAAGRSQPATPVLVGIAASDGVGIGATNPDRENWVAQLGTHLPTGSRVINLGISGATATQALEQELPVAIDSAPSSVAVWLGVNDYQQRVSLATFSDSLSRLLTALRASTGARLFVGNMPDLRLLSAFRGTDPGPLLRDVQSWNAEIARVAHENSAVLVDVFSAWSEIKDPAVLVSSDGLHPTSAGYQRLADLFWQSMRTTN